MPWNVLERFVQKVFVAKGQQSTGRCVGVIWNVARMGHDLSEFYEGGLEKGGFSKLNLRKVRRRPGGGGGVDEH